MTSARYKRGEYTRRDSTPLIRASHPAVVRQSGLAHALLLPAGWSPWVVVQFLTHLIGFATKRGLHEMALENSTLAVCRLIRQ